MLCHKLESSIWNFLYMLLMTCKCAWYIFCETRPRGCRVMPNFFNFLIYPYHLWVSLDRDIFVRPLQRVPKYSPFSKFLYPHFLWQSTISNRDNSTLYCQPDSTFYNQQIFKLKYHLNIILALCNDKCIIDVIFKNLKISSVVLQYNYLWTLVCYWMTMYYLCW